MGGSIWGHRSEGELVSLARYGDLSAFDALVARYRPGATVLARQIVRRQDAAEDVVQDAFLAAYKALPQLADPEKFAWWFGSIVRHRARRLSAGDRPVHVPIDDLILCHAPSLAAELEQRDDAEAVRRAIKGLPEEIEPILELYYLQDWDVSRIADFLALPKTTVKWRLHAGRKLMRASLSESMEEINVSGK
jgi:RNA polymerase sigma-70 factor (ECF subfamily)